MDQARVQVPGALDAALLLALTPVMKDFLSGSNVWQEKIQFNVAPTDTSLEYILVSSEAGQINRLLSVENAQKVPVRAVMPVPGTVQLSIDPGQAETYTALVSLTSVATNSYPEFPDWILAKYFNELLHGLIGALYAQPAKPYTSPQLATVHMRKFRQGISLARVSANRQNTYSAQRWRFPSGAI